MNLPRAFVTYMEALGLGIFGTNIYIGGAPLESPHKCWWVVASGGTQGSKNNTGERVKNYILSVYYRSDDAEDLLDTIQGFEETINSKNCTQLTGYDTIEMSCLTFESDQDLDNEDRGIALIQVTISVYQS